MKQLTFRAVLMGSFLGGLMCLSNLYIGLKTGWGLGVAITACILSFTIYKTLMSAFPRFFKTEMTILENNCMQSTASSAGAATGGIIVSAVSAYLMITGAHITWGVLVLWTFFLAALGTFMAIPMKRQMINIERLPFPSGIAAAQTLKSLHGKGADAVLKAKMLGLGGLFGAGLTWLRDTGIPKFLALPSSLNIFGARAAGYSVSFELSGVMVAAGALIGWRMAWSLLLGAVINYCLLAPWLVSLGAISPELGYKNIVAWATWAGASIMVTSALTMLAFQWKTIFSAFADIKKLFVKEKTTSTEVPFSWFALGTSISGLGCVLILHFAFGTSYILGVLAVIMAFFLSMVACRATGEADINPVGAMGKVTQLGFGVLAPGAVVTNLMTAGVTAGAAGAAADLLTDLKSGYLLGANARQQFIAQFLGIFTGTLVIVPVFYLLVPDASALGTDMWPAPAAQVWAAVAKMLSQGLGALHYTARAGMLIGGLIGIILPCIEKFFPRAQRFTPSAMGLGLAMVIPFFNSLSMFLGALIALIINKKSPEKAGPFVIPVSAGVIAGESIMGVLCALLFSLNML